MKRFDGKVALVTGGRMGIGLAIARKLRADGARVITAQRGQDPDFEGIEADLSDAEVPAQVVETVVARAGRLDILVNNAGIARSNEPAETMSDDVWSSVIDINLNGLFWCCRAFGKHMLGRGAGTIVNVGSMSGFIVNRPQEQSQYNASKAAVHQLTRSLAAEWAPRGVRVNAVAPTYIETEMNHYVYNDPELMRHWVGGTPQNRMGRPDEVASVILFLASDAASLMTGSIVLADGGYTCW